MKTAKLLFSGALALAALTALGSDPGVAGQADSAPPSARAVREKAEAEASARGKAVFLGFHASWCIWCKRLDAMINDPEVKPVWDKYFVTAGIDCEEHGAKVALENAGWAELLREYHGQNAGIPFFVFLDSRGVVLADSRDPENMGYPAGQKDTAAFLAAVRASAPSITDAEIAVLRGYLRRNSYGQN